MEEAKRNFELGVNHIFDSWMAIHFARQYESGGVDTEEKVEDLLYGVLEQFNWKRLRVGVTLPVMEEMFDDYFVRELMTVVEDGSIQTVCTQIYQLWDDCRAGRYKMVERLGEIAAHFKAKYPADVRPPIHVHDDTCNHGNDDDVADEEEEEGNDEDGGKVGGVEEEDDDSWETVSYKRK